MIERVLDIATRDGAMNTWTARRWRALAGGAGTVSAPFGVKAVATKPEGLHGLPDRERPARSEERASRTLAVRKTMIVIEVRSHPC